MILCSQFSLPTRCCRLLLVVYCRHRNLCRPCRRHHRYQYRCRRRFLDDIIVIAVIVTVAVIPLLSLSLPLLLPLPLLLFLSKFLSLHQQQSNLL